MIIIFLIVSIIILIIIHELGHFSAAKLMRVRVDEFGVGFPPKIFGKKFGETEYSVNAVPLGGFVRLYGEAGFADGEAITEKERSFSFQPASKRVLILAAGVVMNFILGWLILTAVFWIGSKPRLFVTAVSPESPAAIAGFQNGDVLADFAKAADFINYVDAHRGELVSFRVIREDAAATPVMIQAVPRVQPPADEGALGVGISELGIERLGFWNGLWTGLKRSGIIFGAIFAALGGLVKDLFSGGGVPEGIVGPVGIYAIASETSRFGYLYLLQIMAVISLNLAALNVLPIPALDGGRLLFIAIEKIKGSPVKRARENLSHLIGFLVVIALMIAITARDVINFL